MRDTIQFIVTVFFTSVELFNSLLDDGIYACGTLKSNRRGYPAEFKKYLKKGLGKRGKSIQLKDGNKVFALWQDNKVVTMLSTNCKKGRGTVLRKQKNGSRITVSCPLHYKTSKNHYFGENFFFAFYYSPVNKLSIDILLTLLIVFFPMFTLHFSPTFLKPCFGFVISIAFFWNCFALMCWSFNCHSSLKE